MNSKLPNSALCFYFTEKYWYDEKIGSRHSMAGSEMRMQKEPRRHRRSDRPRYSRRRKVGPRENRRIWLVRAIPKGFVDTRQGAHRGESWLMNSPGRWLIVFLCSGSRFDSLSLLWQHRIPAWAGNDWDPLPISERERPGGGAHPAGAFWMFFRHRAGASAPGA
jgi:hypothetical protein